MLKSDCISGKNVTLQRETLDKDRIMDERKFKNRTERAEWLDAQRGWGPMTEEEKAILDDAVRFVTNLDSKPRYAAISH